MIWHSLSGYLKISLLSAKETGKYISFKNLNTSFNITTKISYFTDIQRVFEDNPKFDSLMSAHSLSFVDQSVHALLRTNAHYLLDSERNVTK